MSKFGSTELLRISDEELDSAIKFSEIMKIELNEAASILASYAWSIDRALGSIDFNASGLETPKQSVLKEKKIPKQEKKSILREPQKKIDQPQFQFKVIEKGQEGESNLKEELKSPISIRHNNSQIWQPKDHFSLRESKSKRIDSANSQFFLSYITKRYHPRLNFGFDSFAQNLKKSFLERKYILFYIHYMDEAHERQFDEQIKWIMTNEDITKYVNTYFVSFGAFSESNDYKFISHYVSKEKNKPLFVLLKYDHIVRKEVFLSSYVKIILKQNPKTDEFNFLEWISMASQLAVSGEILSRVGDDYQKLLNSLKKKDSFLKKQQEKMQLKQKKGKKEEEKKQDDDGFESFNFGSSFKKKQQQKKQEKQDPSIISNSSLLKSKIGDRRRKPKQQQQQKQERQDPSFRQNPSQFDSKLSNESILSPSIISKRKQDNILMEEQDAAYKKMQMEYMRKREQSTLRHQQSKIKAEDRVQKEKNLQRKRKALQNMFSNDNQEGCINIKFRLPNGQQKLHLFHPNDQIKKLFLYVDLYCRDSFQEKFNEFGLTLIWSDLVLKDCQSQVLDKVLDGEKAVTIIVKEQ